MISNIFLIAIGHRTLNILCYLRTWHCEQQQIEDSVSDEREDEHLGVRAELVREEPDVAGKVQGQLELCTSRGVMQNSTTLRRYDAHGLVPFQYASKRVRARIPKKI